MTGFHYKRPQGEQLDNANPSRSEDTGLWQCPFCSKNDFPELSEVRGVLPGLAAGGWHPSTDWWPWCALVMRGLIVCRCGDVTVYVGVVTSTCMSVW